MYYFINDPRYGISDVRDDYWRSWINDSSINADQETNYYHHIIKNKKDNFYKYFVTKECNVPKDYEPYAFHKLVYLEDAAHLGMKVHSQFAKVERDERIHSQRVKMFTRA